MSFNFDDDDLWSPMRNKREWERQLRDGEREPASLYEALEPMRELSSYLTFIILRRLVKIVRLMTRVAMWIDAKVNR